MNQKTSSTNVAESPDFDPKRRSFLGAMATAAGATLAPGVILYGIAKSSPAKARALDAAASPSVRWGILVDVNRCDSDCDACVTACVDEHGLTGKGRPETDAQWIRKVQIKDPQTGNSITASHCPCCACIVKIHPASMFARQAPHLNAPTGSCWWINTPVSVVVTA